MKQIILGTAGHIDHGKTSLIKALTGIDTDRLKEEKQRGITIELGFASLQLPSGQHLGIVDVPGHEKFVKNMVAGATGIDMVAMVIAADEGVMPQTREHMEICTLLGVRHGLVALTKTDLVDEDWLELVSEDVNEFVRGTFLEGAPLIPVSAASGSGLTQLVAAFDALSTEIPERQDGGLFRLPIDRVFSMKGFGTVITGTLASGNVKVGETIMIYPSGTTSKVRGLQAHNQSVEQAEAGMRTAINFQGIERSTVCRGEVVARPGTLKPSYMVDLSFHYLASNKKPIKSRTRIRFHTGTSEVLGNLVLLESEELAPGKKAMAQVRLESPVVLVRSDRFVIRSYSPVRTIGGGQVLNPIPSKHKARHADIISGLNKMLSGDLQEMVSLCITVSGYRGASFADLKIMTNLSDKQLSQILQQQLSAREALQIDRDNQIYVHRNHFDDLQERIKTLLTSYHRTHPLKEGMPKEELRSKLPAAVASRLFNQLLLQLIKAEKIIQSKDTVRLAAHSVSLAADQTDVREKILQTYRQSGLTPPYFKDLCRSLQVDAAQAKDVLMLLVGDGLMVKAKEELYFDNDAIAGLKNKMLDFFKDKEELTTPLFKEMTGVSRKYLIPLLEYFDARNFTIRVGDVRKLRGK